MNGGKPKSLLPKATRPKSITALRSGVVGFMMLLYCTRDSEM